MVCGKCEKKLAKLSTPDVRRTFGKGSSLGYGKVEEQSRRIGSDTLSKSFKQSRAAPYMKKCFTCKRSMYQDGMHCAGCAHQKGLCTMCGKKIVDISSFRMDQSQMNPKKKVEVDPESEPTLATKAA